MEQIKDLLEQAGDDQGLREFLARFDPGEELTLDSAMRVINSGNGVFTEPELVFLLLENVIRSARRMEEW
ncbi:MAG: hypothetical protein AB1487_06195 [Thermodesulfobacteriota bacterium]